MLWLCTLIGLIKKLPFTDGLKIGQLNIFYKPKKKEKEKVLNLYFVTFVLMFLNEIINTKPIHDRMHTRPDN